MKRTGEGLLICVSRILKAKMIWLGVLITIVACVNGQLTAQTSVAPELRECYLNPELINRNNLPPTTMRVLIDIIQKLEDSVGMNLRELSASLLHTYRQDGIEFHQPDSIAYATSSNVLPYAPTFHSFHRHRLLISRLIPNNLPVMANTTLNSKLKCVLHHMLSTTVDSRVRGDENNCNQLSQYRSLRTVRNIKPDVEILNPRQLKSANRRTRGNMRQFNPKDDIEYTNYGNSQFEKQISGSSCPLLGGVVSTAWGAVSGGNLIAGIAAGAEIQQVPTVDLAKGAILNYNDVQASVTNIFPATLSGDLAEAILIQGTERGSATIAIGSTGGWNSSQAHRHYMLNSVTNNEMTDPEIRGGNDGFILGNRVTQGVNNVKLSQLLDMYYSSRNGVFDPLVRACNRRTLIQQSLSADRLVSETYAFAAALDTNIPLRGTIIGGLQALVTNAVTNYESYSNNNLNGNSCETDVTISRMKTNLYIALDSSWEYQAVYPAISYLLDSIEVGKYGSSITLLSALDGSVLVNTTYSLADFHSEYTLTKHQSFFPGVNLANSLGNIRLMMQDTLRNESLRNYVGGNATVLLYMLHSGTIDNNANVLEQARLLNDTVPDLRLIFATASNQLDNLWNLVRDMHNDIKNIALTSAGTNVEIVMGPVLSRVREVGRRVVNPLCGADFTAGASGTRRFDDFIEPGYTNYYSISPNYFFGPHTNRKIKIVRSTVGSSNLRVCYSRSVPQPGGSNSTVAGVEENAITCQVIASSGNANVEIGLQNACDAYWTINSCPPLYISVQAESTAANPVASAICNDVSVCRFPFNIRYQVEIEDFGCFSGSAGVTASLVIILSAYILTLF